MSIKQRFWYVNHPAEYGVPSDDELSWDGAVMDGPLRDALMAAMGGPSGAGKGGGKLGNTGGAGKPMPGASSVDSVLKT
ncbi:hypothetical protein JOE60_000249 [Paenarthrobacter ilicis]|uniref:Uncharacterized protein n=1 Tax=Paenarthrobacter ilicis TaxID=43665 RepID=A0ABX0TQK9_9MICC|nr:hypothetical protein [Paenarthrobacter ilicis]NIJ03136.1 hypothetical protein [Paenarthrobacter ilicis]